MLATPIAMFFEPFALMIFLALGSSPSNSAAVGAFPAIGSMAFGASVAPFSFSGPEEAAAAFLDLAGFASSVAFAAGFSAGVLTGLISSAIGGKDQV